MQPRYSTATDDACERLGSHPAERHRAILGSAGPARELTRVALPDTESVWLETARGKTLRGAHHRAVHRGGLLIERERDGALTGPLSGASVNSSSASNGSATNRIPVGSYGPTPARQAASSSRIAAPVPAASGSAFKRPAVSLTLSCRRDVLLALNDLA